MASVREYLLTVAAAAIICALAKQIVGEKSASGKIVKVVSGVFLTVTLLTPLINIRLDDLESYFEDTRSMAASATEQGVNMASDAMGEIIKQKTEAYILDEAKSLGMEIAVEVRLRDSDPPVPCQVTITGTVSPYKKTALCRYIENNLGIPQECQQWI